MRTDGAVSSSHTRWQTSRRRNFGKFNAIKIILCLRYQEQFWIRFDPVTNNLWETENGPVHGDEINLVYPGFNSGWHEIYGFSYSQQKFDINKLVTFDGKGKYSEPKLVWGRTAGLTSLIFLNSDKLGTQYRNDMFRGDVHNGRIYHFKLNPDRTDLVLPNSLESKFFTSLYATGVEKILFGQGFGGITESYCRSRWLLVCSIYWTRENISNIT